MNAEVTASCKKRGSGRQDGGTLPWDMWSFGKPLDASQESDTIKILWGHEVHGMLLHV